MILLAMAAAAAAQWTGPHTEEYDGPGYFCGGGYAVHLLKGDRALVLPQSASAGVQGVRLVLGGREVNLWSGAPRESGRLVLRYGGTIVTEQAEGRAVSYTVSDQTDFALRLTSSAFRGFGGDTWFFARANFRSTAENGVHCLAAVSY
ncbi:MAG TPA: hypothetical protein VE968_07865 [Sphingomicrobium sp.]|nr:hypothetical protein [Sphingomicrobium sp.]